MTNNNLIKNNNYISEDHKTLDDVMSGLSNSNKLNTYEKEINISALTKEFIDKNNTSITSVAQQIGVSRTTLSLYLNAKYPSDSAEVEEKLTELLRNTGFFKKYEEDKQAYRTPTFYKSTDSLNVLGICQSCQEYGGLGVIVGKSGFGKTYTLKQYAKVGRVSYVECDDSMSTRDLLDAIEKALGMPNSSIFTMWKRTENLKDFFNTNKGYLLIIDEADKLMTKQSQKKIEILRAIFDQSKVGMVLAGEPALEAKLKSYLPRLANRVDFYTSLHGVTRKEVQEYLAEYKFSPEAIEEMYRRATNAQTGCFRLLDRTIKNILRIVRPGEEINLRVISEASSMMML